MKYDVGKCLLKQIGHVAFENRKMYAFVSHSGGGGVEGGRSAERIWSRSIGWLPATSAAGQVPTP